MANPCVAHGGSQSKPGFGVALDITTGGLVARFANTAGWFSALVAGAIAGAHYELSTFCGNDPPVEPTLTAGDFVDALSIADFEAKRLAEAKILQWVGAHVWYDTCQCADGTNPTPPSYQSAPASLPQKDPPSVVPPLLPTPCNVSSRTQFGITSGSWQMGFSASYVGLPVTAVRITMQNVVTVGVGVNVTFNVVHSHTPFTTTINDEAFQQTSVAGSTHTATVQLNPLSHEFHADITVTATGGASNLIITWEAFCGTSPTQPVTPCCPPDPQLTSQIQQILDLVTLIQRQAVPFGYIASGVHSGLSGAGALSISGILGVKVSVTTLPTSYGVAGTSPPEHFDLGFLTFGTVDGFPSAFRLTRNPQVMMPARCGVYTDLDYDLSPGVVVTITELRREP